MSQTFRDFLVAEAKESEIAAQQDHFVNVVTDIKQVIRALDLSSQTESSEAYTFMDLTEALNTLEDVIVGRLSTEGAMVDDRKGGERHVDTANAEHWAGDADRGFERFFESIGAEAKEAIRNVFGGIPANSALGNGGNDKGENPLFVRAFNSLIVERIINAMQEMGPDRARETFQGMINIAKQAVTQQSQVSDQPLDLRQLTQKYGTKRAA